MKRITDACIRLYIDTGQTIAYVEGWSHPWDATPGADICFHVTGPLHTMTALLDQAKAQGVEIRREAW